MRLILAKNWWSLVLRGLVGIVLGVIAFTWPGITFTSLVFLFAGYALLTGALSLAGAMRAAEAGERWGALLFEGLAGILAAFLTALWPAITALVLVLMIGVWAIVAGIAEIAAAVRLRRHIQGEWLLAFAGVVSVLFGVMLASMPMTGALVIAWWVGAYMLVSGVTLVALGFRLRHWSHDSHSGATPIMPAPAH
jgi:uncharacterized membrane protein HdeD (DUF308 family)